MAPRRNGRVPRRRLAAFALALASTVTTGVRAETSPSSDETPAVREAPAMRRNIVSTNPVRYAILHFQVEYERIVADRWSLFIAPIFFHHATWYPFAPSDDMTANGGGLDLGFRYTFGNAPAGLFVGPLLSGYRTEVRRAGVKTLDGYVFSGGVQAGYTWLIDRLLLSAGVGLSYGVPTEQGPDGGAKAAHLPHKGLWVNFRANAGVTF